MCFSYTHPILTKKSANNYDLSSMFNVNSIVSAATDVGDKTMSSTMDLVGKRMSSITLN